MNIIKILFGKNEDDKLYDESLNAFNNLKIEQLEVIFDKMSDDGLYKAAEKYNYLANKNKGFILINTFLAIAFEKRPHLKSPYLDFEENDEY